MLFGQFFQGMYKNRVENDRNFFEIPALLSCEQGNSAENRVWENSKYVCCFEFSCSGFPCSKDKSAGISKKILYLPDFIHTLDYLKI